MEPCDTNLPVILGRPFINKVEKVCRGISRFFPHYNVDRKEGITAVMKIRNEPLAAEALATISDYVDQVVVVDASDTPVHLQGKKVTYITAPAEQNLQVKLGMLLSRYRWVLRWDGDFHPAKELPQLLTLTKQYPRGYWQIKALVRNINAIGKPVSVQKECYLFTYHPRILTVDFQWETQLTDMIAKVKGGMPGRICYGTLPYFFGDIQTNLVFAKHYFESKSQQRLVERKYQAQWSMLSDGERSVYMDFDAYVQEQVNLV